MGTRHPEPPLTEDQLAKAWRHLRRPGWPPTLEEVLQHPLRGNLVRGLARSFGRDPHQPGRPHHTHGLPTAAAVPATPDQKPAKPPMGRHAKPQPRAGKVQRTPRVTSTPSVLPTSIRQRGHHQAGTHDCKRAAANDRDD